MAQGRTTRLVAVGVLLFLCFGGYHPTRADQFNGLFGYRSFDGVWEPMEGHQFVGFEYDLALKKPALHLSAGLNLSSTTRQTDDGWLMYTMSVSEITFGVKKLWKPGRIVRPYVGGGVAWVWNAHFEIDPITLETATNDSSTGFYGVAGVLWRVGRRCNLGIDVRMLRGAEASFTQRSGSLDYEQVSILAGVNWGRDRDRRARAASAEESDRP